MGLPGAKKTRPTASRRRAASRAETDARSRLDYLLLWPRAIAATLGGGLLWRYID
jgi:hypothetical protein